MEGLSEFDGVHQASLVQDYNLKKSNDPDNKRCNHDNDDSLTENMNQDTDSIVRRDVLNMSAGETGKSENFLSMDCIRNSQLKTMDGSLENDRVLTAADDLNGSRQSSNVFPVNISGDVTHLVNGQGLCDFPADCDDSVSIDAALSTGEVAQGLKQEGDNWSKVDGDLGTETDSDVSLWLKGTIRHLHTNAALNGNLTLDENDLDIDNEMPEEDTVEVQEFLQEEEIAEETTADDDAEDSSSKEDEKPLRYDLQQGYKILREIMGSNNKSITWAFVHAVDRNAEGCHDYYEKIKNPMWLTKMKEKFERREYENITEYVADMRLMLENCYRFNGLNHPISRNGEKLEQMMEQKLLLLSRELREKTSLAATSGKAVDIPLTGTRRLKFSGATGTTTLLHRLRWEAVEKQKEIKRQQQLDKKMAYEEFLKGLQAWEDKLFAEPLRQQMKAMWELPQIGQFLFLCQKALNLGEVSQYELECCLLLPRESSALQRIMTSLLSTPHQRARIQGKTLMSYRVWDERLRVMLRQWYKTYEDNCNSTKLTAVKLGLDEKFFKVLGHKNPLERKKFHELTFYQRVWILKSLCDHCLETQKSICEVMESQPLLDLKESILGRDNDGNIYIHFPQFCGEDLRIYRQSPQVLVVEGPSKESVSCTKVQLKRRHKHKGRNNVEKFSLELPDPPTLCATPRTRDSRLRQNPKQVQSYKVTESSSSSDAENSSGEEEDDENEELDEDEEEVEEEENEESEELGEELDEEKKEENEKEKEEGDDDEDDNDKISVSAEMEQEEEQSRQLRGRGRQNQRSKNEKERETLTPDPWNVLDNPSAVIPRRSLRKIIEESKKDAVSSPAASASSRTPLRRSSFSSGSSATLSRSGRDSVSSHLQSGGKKEFRTSCRTSKRKRGNSLEVQDDDDDEDADVDCSVEESSSSLPASTSRVTTRSNLQRRTAEKQAEKSPRKSRSQATASSRRNSPEPLELGRITRNLYKILLEAKIDVHDNDGQRTRNAEVSSRNLSSKNGKCSSKQSMCSADDSSVPDEISKEENSEKKVKSDNRRKKRSCLTAVSSTIREPTVDIIKLSGDVSSVDPRTGAEKGFDADESDTFNVDSIQGDAGQGDAKIRNSLNKNSVVAAKEKNDVDVKEELEDEKMIEELKQVASETAAQDILSTTENTHDDLKITPSLSSGNSFDGKPSLESISSLSEIKSVENQPKEEMAEEKASLQSTNTDAVVKLDEENPRSTTGLKSGADVAVETTVKDDADEVCEILGPEIGPFELIVENIEGLRNLVDKFADKEGKDLDSTPSHPENKETDGKGVYRKRCTVELHKRLSFLLQEVGVYEPRLIKLNKRKMIRLRKEQENYKEEPEKEQVEDIWENNDSTSCASNGNTEAANDESSVDAESWGSRIEDKSDETQKKLRPSRTKQSTVSETLPGTLPSTPSSEVASHASVSSSSCGAINTRKRTAQSRGRAQSAKKAKVTTSSAENDPQNSKAQTGKYGGILVPPEFSSTPQNAKDSVLRGLVSCDATANKKQCVGQQSANVTGNRFNLPLEKQSALELVPRCLATSTNLMARLIFSLPNAVSSLPSAVNRVASNSAAQHSTLCVALGRTMQPVVQQNIVRLATSSGSNVQLLAVSNLSQLSPSILQQLLNSQNLVMVAPSVGVRNASTGSSAVTVPPSGSARNGALVPGSLATGNIQNIRTSNAGQIRPLSLQNLPFEVVSRPSGPAGRAVFNSFQYTTTRAALSSVPSYVLSSQLTSSGIVAAPGRLNSPNSLTAGDPTMHQKYTNSLTVRALLGNRSVADQAQNLLSCSLPTNFDAAVSSSVNTDRLALTTANLGNISSVQSLIGGRIIDDRLIGRTAVRSTYVGSSTSVESAVGLIVKCTSASNLASLPFQNSLSSVHKAVGVNPPRLGFKEERSTLDVDPRMQLSVIIPSSLELGRTLPVIQRLTQNAPGLKLVTTSGASVHRPQQMALTALVSVADQTKQIILVSPEQAAALARKNLVDQAVKAAITGPISTSLPTANLEIPSTPGMPPPPRNVNTHTTTVMKSPIPALPQLFNNNLSPGKAAGHSSMLAPPTSVSQIVGVVSLSSSRASVAQASASTTPLHLSLSTSGASAGAASQAALPILLNSAIVMPGSQNVLVLQQTPMQLLSLDANRSALGQTPLKIAVTLSQPSASLCSVASKPQYSYSTKSLGASVLNPFSSSEHFISNRMARPALSSARLIHLDSPGSVSVPSVLQHSTPQTVGPRDPSLLQIVQPATSKISSHTITVSNLAAVQELLQPLLSPNQAKCQPDNAQVMTAGDIRASCRQAVKIVIPPKYDGIPLGQLPIQGGIRLFNRLPSGIVAVGQQLPQSASSQTAKNVNIVNNAKHLDTGNASQLHGMRLVTPVAAASVLAQEKPSTALPKECSASSATAHAVAPPGERSVLLLQTTGNVTGVSNALATTGLVQPAISQKRPVFQIHANALNVANVKGQVLQLAVQPTNSTFQPTRNQLVQLAVQPVGARSGEPPVTNSSNAQWLQQPIPPAVGSERYAADAQPNCLSLRPFSQSSGGVPLVQNLLLSSVSQAQCTTTDSGLKIPSSNSSAEALHTLATSQAPSRSHVTDQQCFSSAPRMNLEAAANWLLQAASVVDSSSNKEDGSR